jgi:predicted regulator of Ras-like GTPase activity (Roadblock/LC7/MglB family)
MIDRLLSDLNKTDGVKGSHYVGLKGALLQDAWRGYLTKNVM